jgi:transcriptional regulator with XRE-family HTH domain
MKEFGKLVDDAAQSLISRWEKGDNLPNNERLKIIAALGSVTVDELLYGDFQDYCYHVFLDAQDKFFEKYIGEDGFYSADGKLISRSYDETVALKEYNDSIKHGDFNTMDYKTLSHLAEAAIKNNIGKVDNFKSVNELLDELISRNEGNESLVYSAFFNIKVSDGKPMIVLKEGFDIQEYNEIMTVLNKFRNEIKIMKKTN